MTTAIWFVLAALGLGAPAAAPGAPDASAAESAQDAAAKLDALVKRFRDRQNAVHTEYGAAKTDAERQAVLAKLPGKEFIPEFRALAEEARGTDAAAGAWMWIVRLGQEHDKPAALAALEVLLDQHAASEALAELPGDLRYATYALGAEPVVDALRVLAETSPHAKVKGGALFTLAAVLHEDAHGDAAKVAESRALFERVQREFGDVPYPPKGTYGKAAAAFLFELDHLQVGMVAPDFEAVDENGVAFKLSDYRGQVVVVDFWGFW